MKYFMIGLFLALTVSIAGANAHSWEVYRGSKLLKLSLVGSGDTVVRCSANSTDPDSLGMRYNCDCFPCPDLWLQQVEVQDDNGQIVVASKKYLNNEHELVKISLRDILVYSRRTLKTRFHVRFIFSKWAGPMFTLKLT